MSAADSVFGSARSSSRQVEQADEMHEFSNVANWPRALSEADKLRGRARQMEKEGQTLSQMPDRTYLDGRRVSRGSERARGRQLQAEAVALRQHADKIEGAVRNAKNELIGRPDSETLTGMRSWRSRNGDSSITGRAIDFTGSMVTMHRDDGEFFLMPISLLSEEDEQGLRILLKTRIPSKDSYSYRYDQMRERAKRSPYNQWGFAGNEFEFQGRIIGFNEGSLIIESINGTLYEVEEPFLDEKYSNIINTAKMKLYLEPVGMYGTWTPPNEAIPVSGELISFDQKFITLQNDTEIIRIARSKDEDFYNERLSRWTRTPNRLREKIRIALKYSSTEIDFIVVGALSFNNFRELTRYGSAVFEISINGDLAVLVTRNTDYMSSGYATLPVSVIGYRDVISGSGRIMTVPVLVEGKKLDEKFIAEVNRELNQILNEIEIMKINEGKIARLDS